MSTQTLNKAKIPERFSFSLDTPSLSSGTLDKYLKSVLGTDSMTSIPDMLLKTELGNGTAIPDLPTPVAPAPLNNNPIPVQPPTQQQPQQTPIPVAITPVPTIPKPSEWPEKAFRKETHPIPESAHTLPSMNPNEPSNSVPLPRPYEMVQQLMPNLNQSSMIPQMSNSLTTTNETGGEIIPMPKGQAYIDITDYLNMPQQEAAKKLGIPPSTLSKRWKEAVRKRKWPYRMICKIDKEIMTLLHNVPQGPNAPPLPEEIEQALGQLLRKRQEELRPVVIRV